MFWTGKVTSCNVCEARITSTFLDAYMPRFKAWGIVCPRCAEKEGCKTGTGKGQKYERVYTGKDKGKYRKVEG